LFTNKEGENQIKEIKNIKKEEIKIDDDKILKAFPFLGESSNFIYRLIYFNGQVVYLSNCSL